MPGRLENLAYLHEGSETAKMYAILRKSLVMNALGFYQSLSDVISSRARRVPSPSPRRSAFLKRGWCKKFSSIPPRAWGHPYPPSILFHYQQMS